jgi:16S rRNA (cytosine1402-N4)-methyltransferase
MTAAPHVPVLKVETLDLLKPGPGRRLVDGTFGFGGHTEAMLAAGAEVLGLDLDGAAFAACRALAATEPRLSCQNISFRHLDRALAAVRWDKVDGILLDLGVSSFQLDDAAKGFSYRLDGPLDLRFDQASGGRTAADLLRELSEEELADLIWRWGEERGSRRIARAIVQARQVEPVATTGRLKELVTGTLPRGIKTQPVLSRVFQALRIAVNDELEALAEVLARVPQLLRSEGILVVISYHSLEDRLVKQFVDREKRDCLCPPNLPGCVCGHRRSLLPLTRKAVTAGPAEEAANIRSRSARLRAAKRI